LFFEIPAIAFLGVWVILQLQELSTAALFPGMGSSSAWWAHLGGFAVGALIHPLFIDKTTPYQLDVEPTEEL
jgi:membrane associated rhomboid family serine protease